MKHKYTVFILKCKIIMEIKMHNHNFRRMFFDILRDTNTSKYSMTKFAALIGLLLFSATVIMALLIMWETQEIDHVLVIEILGFILTLLGFKNSFGFKGKDGTTMNANGNNDFNSVITNTGVTENTETDPDTGKEKFNEKSLVCGSKKPMKADEIDDTLKG